MAERIDDGGSLGGFQAAFEAALAHPRTGDPAVDLFLSLLPPSQAALAENLALPHWFDGRMVAAAGAGAAILPLEQVIQLPFIRQQGERLAYHDATRTAIRGYLLGTDVPRVRDVSGRLARELERSTPGDDELRRERIFLLLASDERAGLVELTRAFHAARGGRQLSTCAELLALAREQEPLLSSRAQHHVHYLEAYLAFERHEYGVAESLLARVIERELEEDEAWRYGLLHGRVLVALGQPVAGITLLQQVLTRCGGALDPAAAERIHYHLALAWLTCRDLDAAEAEACRSLEINEKLGNTVGVALNRALLASIAVALTDFAKARRYFAESLQLLEATSLAHERSGVLVRRADLERRTGNIEAAQRDLEAAIDIRQGAGDQHGWAVMMTRLARLRLQQQDVDGALQIYEAAREILRGFRDRQREGEVLLAMAKVRLVRGEYDLALQQQREALEVLGEHSELRASAAADLRRFERAARRATSRWARWRQNVGCVLLTLLLLAVFVLFVALAPA